MTESAFKHHLSAAVGYLELGMLDCAETELAELDAERREDPQVLGLSVAIFRESEKWEFMRQKAQLLVILQPDEAQWWIDLAYATRRAASLGAADLILREAETLHAAEPMLHFNLACYASQLGKLDEARIRLEKAVALEKSFRALALEDPDLEPLWMELKREG